jgi:hypothetical protein
MEGMKRDFALSLILSFALLAKALIPSGWMPTGGRAFEITVCAGTDTHSLWLDDKGRLHKQDPDDRNTKSDSKPCAFAGLGAAVDLPVIPPLKRKPLATGATTSVARSVAAIGQGLAAPPPPPTGPPLLI